MTAVVVLAAGLGRRLAGATDRPKWLAPVDGAHPADAHLSAFEVAALGRVHVVVSLDAAHIEDHVRPWRDRLDLHLVSNPHAVDRNNWYSLLLGLEAAADTGDDVIVANSDLFADERWFVDLIQRLRGAGEPAALAVDPSRGRTDEAMKVEVDATRVIVTGIGKVGIEDPWGEYVGLAWWSPEAAAELTKVLAGFEGDPTRTDHWYEHGIQSHVEAGGRYQAVDVPSDRWVEIDDEADLEAARALRSGG